MPAARIIWTIWCLAWAAAWFAIGIHDAAAWATCADANHAAVQLVGAPVYSCGSRLWPLAGFGLAAASGLAILAPVGTGRRVDWRGWLPTPGNVSRSVAAMTPGHPTAAPDSATTAHPSACAAPPAAPPPAC